MTSPSPTTCCSRCRPPAAGSGPIPQSTRTRLVEEYIEALDIRPADPHALMRNLSGGNQQKVLLARWLITEPEILILDEPTRGIDIGAKAQIQAKVAELAAQGLSVVFISAELEEVLRLSDRLVVMRDRRKIHEQTNDDVSVRDVLEIIAGEARAGGSSPMPESPTRAQRVLRHQLLWPVLALLVLLVVNVVAKPAFLDVRMQDGHLYGNLVDIAAQQRTGDARRARHDAGHRHPRHRPLRRRHRRDRGRRSPAPGSSAPATRPR